MAVPAHDERDYEFASKYKLPLKEVVKPKNGEETKLPFTEKGILINSGKYDNLTSEDAKIKITEDLQKEGKGKKTINYRLKTGWYQDKDIGVHLFLLFIVINVE